MRKILSIITFACAVTFALSACNKSEQPQPAAAEQVPTVLAAPTNPADKVAWKQYLVSVVTANLQGVKSNHPYIYFVPGGTDDVATTDRSHQLENVTNIVQRGVLPGNMMAFGGPDSAITAQLVTDAFKEVQPSAFKDVVVLFIGAQTDAGRVKQALESSAADFRFVEAK